jgi:hypothetical protein
VRPGAAPVPGYELVKQLGRGGCGEVWEALAPGGVHVALKFVPLDGKIAELELRGLAISLSVKHPNLLPVLGAWQQDRHLVLALELADGTLLDRHREAVAGGLPGIPRVELLGYLHDAARGIDYLNEPRHLADGGEGRAILHRDVKPSNLLVVGGGVKVGDFGLARFRERTVTRHTGHMTLEYAAPECFDGRVTPWSDQYALAVSYCELRSGRLPFAGSTAEVAAGHLTRSPDLSMLPVGEREAVARALAKEPSDRWPTCRAFADALARAAVPAPVPAPQGPPSLVNVTPYEPGRAEPGFTLTVDDTTAAAPPERPAPAPAPVSGHRRWAWVAALACLVIGASVLLALWPRPAGDGNSGGSPPARPPVEDPLQGQQGANNAGQGGAASKNQLALLQPAAWVRKHAERVESVAFSPTGRHVLSGGRDRVVRLWDAASGTQVREFRGHQNGITAVAFSPSGGAALSVAAAEVFIWDVKDGKRTHAFTHPDGHAISGTFSPDGRLILTAAGKVAFSPDSLFAYSHERSAAVQCWDLASGRALDLDHWKGGPGAPSGIGGSGPIVCPHKNPYPSGSVYPWDLKTGRRLESIGKPFLAASTNGRFRITTRLMPSWRVGLEVWDVTKPGEAQAFRDQPGEPVSAAVSSDGTRAAAVDNDNTIEVWNIPGGTRIQSLRGHEARVFALAFSPDGRSLASGSWDGTVRLWPLRE